MLNISELHPTPALLRQALTNPSFGIWNRNALDIAIAYNQIPYDYAAVIMDIDKFKRVNTLYGKEGSNLRVARSLLRNSDLIYSFFSGDELAAFIPQDEVIAFCLRLQQDFRDNDLSATMIIINCEGIDWHASLNYASNVNDCYKEMGYRGVIVDDRFGGIKHVV